MKYLIPFSYMIKTRYPSLFYKTAFILVYFLPIFLVCGYYHADVAGLIIALIGINCLYEEGYLDNDLITSRYEKTPTLRLKREEKLYFEKKYLLLKAVRIAVFLITVVFLMGKDINSAKTLLLGGAALTLSYAFHNTIRSEWNILTFSALVVLKYLVPILCCQLEGREIEKAFTAVFTVICIPRIFEYSLKYSRKYKKLLDRKEIMRFLYYFLLLCITAVWFLTKKEQGPMMVLVVYYFIFRTIDVLRSVRRRR